jgi:hypothetical protein
MPKVSKVSKVVGEKPWNDVFFISVEMENGDAGQIYSKTSGSVKVGDELNYDIDTSKGEGKHSIKLVKSGSNGGFQKKAWVGEDPESKIAGIAFSYSVQLCVAGKIEVPKVPELAESIALKMQALTAKLKSTAPKPTPDASV